MTSRPPNTDFFASSSSELLQIVTQFASDLGAMTDLTTIGNRIIQELCRAGATTHGALFVLDREHECYLSEAKDLFAPEPYPGLSFGLKRSFVAALLRMTTIANGRRRTADGCRPTAAPHS